MNFLYTKSERLWAYNAALRCERRLAILERSETAKRCESLLNALLVVLITPMVGHSTVHYVPRDNSRIRVSHSLYLLVKLF